MASVPRIHRAWWVAAVTLAALVAAAGFRSTTGALIEPIEADFGWSRGITSGAVSINLLFYGLTAPFAAALMERFGVRRVAAGALTLIALGAAGTIVMTQPWHLWTLWGVLVGLGSGSMALVFGAIVATRWFEAHRGLVMGVFSAASSTGQLVFLPAIAHLAQHPGWRYAAGLTAVCALALVPVVWMVMRDRPADVGLRPYGAREDWLETPTTTQSPARFAMATLRGSLRSWPFWALMITFWVCGWSTNGLIGTHFIPAAHDHGMPPTTAAGLLASIGVLDIIGTIASGWLTDRVDSRYLLFGYYFFRGLSLLIVPMVLGPSVEPPLLFFVVFYGLDWVATVPPTVALCRLHFGPQRSGVVFGWVFASHMVGAAVASSYAGVVRERLGDYYWAWITAGAMCVVAAVICLTIPKRPPVDSRILDEVVEESAQI